MQQMPDARQNLIRTPNTVARATARYSTVTMIVSVHTAAADLPFCLSDYTPQ